MQLTDKEWTIWAAAWVDAEGHISVTRRESKTGRHPYRYQVTLAVDNKFRAPLTMLQNHLGGHIYHVKGSKTSMTARKTWRWQESGKEALRIVSQIEPYLVLKRKRARPLAKVYRESPHLKGLPFTDKEYSAMEKVYNTMMRHWGRKNPELSKHQ